MRGTHAELLLALWASIGFKPGDFMTAGMNEKRIAQGTQVSKGDVKAVIEQMATVGYKELNESSEFVIPGKAAVRPNTEV